MGNEDFSRQMQGQRRVICLIFAEDFVGKRVPLVSTFGKNSLRPLNKSDVSTSVRGTFDAFRTGKVAASSLVGFLSVQFQQEDEIGVKTCSA